MSGFARAKTSKSIFSWLLRDLILLGIIGVLLYSYTASTNPLSWLSLALMLGLIPMVVLSVFYHLHITESENKIDKNLRNIYLIVGLSVFTFGFGSLYGVYWMSTENSFISLLWQYTYEATFPMLVALIWAVTFYCRIPEKIDTLISA